MSKKIPEIFFNNMFECNSFACHCTKDIENVAPGQPPRTTLKLYADENQPLRFAYAPKYGLNQTGVAGGAIEKNILGKILALPDDDIDSCISFIEHFGFLLPVKNSEYESVDSEVLLKLINKIKATIHLMNAIAGNKNYKNILIMTAYLLYSNPIEISLSDYTYTSCCHKFTELIRSYNYFPDLNRNQEVFENGTYSVPDTLTGNNAPVDINFFNAVRSGSDTSLEGSNDPDFKNLVAMYTGLLSENDDLRIIIDFFYHYQTNVGIFKKTQYNRIRYYSTPNKDNFSDDMKAALLKIARIVISEEINHNIKGIHPKYNAEELAPTWQVNNLLQALYFSIFYMKPGIEIYKQCKNQNCKRDRFFLVEATRTNKEYCCIQCSRGSVK